MLEQLTQVHSASSGGEIILNPSDKNSRHIVPMTFVMRELNGENSAGCEGLVLSQASAGREFCSRSS